MQASFGDEIHIWKDEDIKQTTSQDILSLRYGQRVYQEHRNTPLFGQVGCRPSCEVSLCIRVNFRKRAHSKGGLDLGSEETQIGRRNYAALRYPKDRCILSTARSHSSGVRNVATETMGIQKSTLSFHGRCPPQRVGEAVNGYIISQWAIKIKEARRKRYSIDSG